MTMMIASADDVNDGDDGRLHFSYGAIASHTHTIARGYTANTLTHAAHASRTYV